MRQSRIETFLKGRLNFMAKYKLLIHFSDGTVEEEDNNGEFFSSKEEADDAGSNLLNAYQTGGWTLNMSNPGDYPYDEADYEDNWWEVVKVK